MKPIRYKCRIHLLELLRIMIIQNQQQKIDKTSLRKMITKKIRNQEEQMKMQNKLIYLKEPSLTFGYNQKIIDPRDGITLFGPFSKDKVPAGNIGIIGTKVGIDRLKKWL